MLQPVVAGLDGSRESTAAAHWAAGEALRRGLPLRLVRAWEALRAVHAWHVPLGRGVIGAGERARIREAAEQALSALVEPWQRTYPTVFLREELHEGVPAHVLARAARGAGLLVAGRRRRRAAIGSRTGPVARALIHHVGRPVAVVPHD